MNTTALTPADDVRLRTEEQIIQELNIPHGLFDGYGVVALSLSSDSDIDC